VIKNTRERPRSTPRSAWAWRAPSAERADPPSAPLWPPSARHQTVPTLLWSYTASARMVGVCNKYLTRASTGKSGLRPKVSNRYMPTDIKFSSVRACTKSPLYFQNCNMQRDSCAAEDCWPLSVLWKINSDIIRWNNVIQNICCLEIFLSDFISGESW